VLHSLRDVCMVGQQRLVVGQQRCTQLGRQPQGLADDGDAAEQGGDIPAEQARILAGDGNNLHLQGWQHKETQQQSSPLRHVLIPTLKY